MSDTIRLYFDATLALANMAALGVIAGLITAGISGDRTLIIIVAAGVFALTGAILAIRLWLITRKIPWSNDSHP